MIFVDSNIPMYLIGAPHPNKEAALRAIEVHVKRSERMVTSAEVLQEILHRYHAIRRLDAIQPAFDALLGIVDEVFPVETKDIQRAKELMMGVTPLSARDALHVAIMKRRDVQRVMSFDKGFDSVPGLERLS